MGSAEGVGVDEFRLGGGAPGLYFGEYVEVLEVASVAEPLLVLLHGNGIYACLEYSVKSLSRKRETHGSWFNKVGCGYFCRLL